MPLEVLKEHFEVDSSALLVSELASGDKLRLLYVSAITGFLFKPWAGAEGDASSMCCERIKKVPPLAALEDPSAWNKAPGFVAFFGEQYQGSLM
ncbi:hypothetical protein VTL71DRAFT_7136 [Oculimacula yallundae]|uniref:Uncharacterized protein n=1 Tax=Oculimacula yallundae TaxID=86028 RepID=A0ABR4BVV7_9HELO